MFFALTEKFLLFLRFSKDPDAAREYNDDEDKHNEDEDNHNKNEDDHNND